jgi:colicin import membrane protein
MSTIPNRKIPKDADLSDPQPISKRKRPKASFRYGYREVRKKLPNGEVAWKRIPLTLDDVLHPRFGDVHVLGDPHGDDCNYLKIVLKARYADDPSVVIFSDTGIFWDVPELRHHSPDLSVIFGVKERKDWNTFQVAEEQTRPSLIIEVTSPNTRVNDVKTKVEQYAQAQVPHYVIADARQHHDKRTLSFIAYELKGTAYEQVPLDERGRAWLAPVSLWLGTRLDPQTGSDRVALIDPTTDSELGDYIAINRERTEALEQLHATTEQLHATTEQLHATTEQLHVAAQRAEAESNARAIAEARTRELEAELARLRKHNTL